MDWNDIINKYLDDTATEEEKQSLLAWLEEKEENRDLFRQCYDIWLGSNAFLIPDKEMEKALTRFDKRITAASRKDNRPAHTIGYYFLRIAAVILLLLSTGYAGYLIGDYTAEPVMVMNKLLTASDGKGRFELPDGSVVWLNANSQLEYPEVFQDNQRKVHLEGEAYFEITPNKRKPFRVEAGGMEVEVLGTRFLVQNYADKPLVEAVLVEGSVQVKGGYFPQPQVLLPGQLLSYDRKSAQTSLRTVKSADYISWIQSRLVFDNDLLADIMINLERWYGVEITATPEFANNTRLSFTVRRESLEEVLKFMTITTSISYKWENDQLYLFPKQ